MSRSRKLIKMVEETLVSLGPPVDATVVPKAINQRKLDRVVCKSCGDIYPAGKSKICMSCGAPFRD